MVVDGLGVLLRRIDPGLHDFEDEEIVFRHEPRVGHAAFEIGEALGDQRRLDLRGGRGRERLR